MTRLLERLPRAWRRLLGPSPPYAAKPLLIEDPFYTLALPAGWRMLDSDGPDGQALVSEDGDQMLEVHRMIFEHLLQDTALIVPDSLEVHGSHDPPAQCTVRQDLSGHIVEGVRPDPEAGVHYAFRTTIRPHGFVTLYLTLFDPEADGQALVAQIAEGLTIAPLPSR
jgi:hypothetical protein